MSIFCFGDSITVGVSANPSSLSWVGLLTPVNNAQSGDQAAEVSKDIQTVSVNPLNTYTIMVGTNDHRTYKADASRKEYFKRFLRQAVAWLALPTKVKGRDAGFTYTGTWNNTVINTFGKYTTATSSTAITSVSGTSIYVGYVIQNSTQAKGTAKVFIDGTSVGSLATDGSSPTMNTVNGSTYAAACMRYSGLSNGLHEVKIVVDSVAGKYYYVDYVAGNDQVATPKILLSNIIPMTSAGYTTYGTSVGNVNDYNTIISDLVTEFTNDGLNVVLVDNFTDISPATDFTADGIHPNNSGHAKISENFKVEL